MKSFVRYGHEDLRAFLREVDMELSSEQRVLIIGGASMALAYQGKRATSDVDTFGNLSPDLSRAIAQANSKRSVPIPFSSANTADVPYEYESRVVRVMEDELKHLAVFVLERHDLALSKIIRWHEGDEAHVRELHGSEPLEENLLIGRFLEEMTHVMGDAGVLRQNLLSLIETLFGELAAERAKQRVPERWAELR